MYELLGSASEFIVEYRIIFIVYLSLLNLTAFVFYAADKNFAKSGRRRVPEAVLIRLAVFGGSLGAFIGMHLFRHKTKHLKFLISIPLLLLLHIAAVTAVIVISH